MVTVEYKVKALRCPFEEPTVTDELVRAEGGAHNDAWRTIRLVQHPADCVVERGLGIETSCHGVAEPVHEPVNEATEPVGRVPFPGLVQVQAQPCALENVSMVEETKVIHLDSRGSDVGRSHDNLKLLVVAQPEPARNMPKSTGADPQAQAHRAVAVPRFADQLDLARERQGECSQVRENPGLPLTGAPRAHPARPACFTVDIDEAAATLETALNFPAPADPAHAEPAGALKPSPNSACHFFTLSSKSVSS